MSLAGIQREEDKVKKSIKDAAKRGDTQTCKMLAKEVVRSRKAVTRMHTSKAQMNSVVMQMENQLGAPDPAARTRSLARRVPCARGAAWRRSASAALVLVSRPSVPILAARGCVGAQHNKR